MIWRILAATALALLFAAPVQAQSWGQLQYEAQGKRVGPFGEAGTYELTNIFSYQSAFGLSYRHDIETTTNSGAITLDGGYIELTTGATTGSTAQIDTVERGQYQPGKGAEAGIGFYLVTPPDSGTETAAWGLGDGDNGIFWRYTDNNSDGDFELCVVYERATNETVACGGDGEGGAAFNGRLGNFDPASDGAVWVVRFNWYGFGGAEWFIYEPDANANGTMREHLVHSFVPATGQALDDPNLPVFARVDNGDGTTNVEAEVGGRRYDIQGQFRPDTRLSGDYRTAQTVTASGNPLTPLVCVRREDPFPEAGRQNSVNVYIEGWDVQTDNDLIVWFMGVDDLADLTGESFGTPSQHADTETAIETDTSATAIASTEFISGPWMRAGGDTGNAQQLTSEKGRRIPLVATNPTCLVAIAPGGADATVTSSLRVVEEW